MAVIAALLLLGSPIARAETVATVSGSVVNVRSAPSTSAAILAEALRNETYYVTDEQNGWYRIRIGNHSEAWISGDYVSIANSATLPGRVRPQVSVLNVRSAAQIADGNIIGTATSAQYLAVSGESGYWYRISFNGGEGYVAKWLVEADYSSSAATTPADTAAPAESGAYADGVVNTEVLNLRDAASSDSSSQIIGSLKRGDKLKIFRVSGDWYYVMTDYGSYGWVYASFIDFSEARVASAAIAAAARPAFSGSAAMGEISAAYQSTAYGYQITLSSSDYICYTLDEGSRRLTVNTDMHISGGEFTAYGISAAVSGSLGNIYTVSGDTPIYYSVKAAADGRTLTIQVGTSPLVGRIIFLDPGHASTSDGALDPGAIGASGLLEKDVNYDIALRAAELLRAQGATVVLSRGVTTDLTLAEIAAAANISGAEVFISIHCNAADNSATNGSSTWIYPTDYDTASSEYMLRTLLATHMQNAMLAAGGLNNYGIFQNSFAVLRLTDMPAALLEVGFISNAGDEAKLATASFRAAIAEGIVNGLRNYFLEAGL
ncbi:MAG: N-acetylmuramoyl-L-alanine amidase [Bacillota bacterium]|nr:N-acetylmuramoyl-L-alanine amidase [Bacillota bacterium]